MSTGSGFQTGRPFGGLAILYRKSLCSVCKIIKYDDACNRIMSVEIQCEYGKLLLINVYFPYESRDNLDEFCG